MDFNRILIREALLLGYKLPKIVKWINFVGIFVKEKLIPDLIKYDHVNFGALRIYRFCNEHPKSIIFSIVIIIYIEKSGEISLDEISLINARRRKKHCNIKEAVE